MDTKALALLLAFGFLGSSLVAPTAAAGVATTDSHCWILVDPGHCVETAAEALCEAPSEIVEALTGKDPWECDL